MYGIDLMIDQDWNPQILEINFSPDTQRACNYDPNYYNNVFAALFLNKEDYPQAWESITNII